MARSDALVVGAGVCGLTTAISLAEAGLTTRIVTASPSAQTTSAAAGAVWGPVLCGPPELTKGWARTGLEVLTELQDDPASGVRLAHGREVARTPVQPPEWIDLLDSFRQLGAAELPDGFISGWAYSAPLVTMGVYLDYLQARFARAGGGIEVAPVRSLRDITDAPLIVNCTGIGARDLVPDPEVVPYRGQVVIVTNPGIDEFYIDHGDTPPDYVYFFPHGDTVLLGGTAAEGAWDLPANPDIAERIIADCCRAEPLLRRASIITHRVGLRPYRPRVRLESQPLDDGRVLWHNYGHGGAGVTLSWGCAREIADAVLADRGQLPSRRSAGAPELN